MAVTPVLKKSSAALILNGGSDMAGRTIKKSASLGTVKGTATDDQVYNVAAALASCVEFPVLEVNRSQTVQLEME